jgi:hypothetical protein
MLRNHRAIGDKGFCGCWGRRELSGAADCLCNRCLFGIGTLFGSLVLMLSLDADLDILFNLMLVQIDQMRIKRHLLESDPATAWARGQGIVVDDATAIAGGRLNASAQTVANINEANDAMLILGIRRLRVSPVAEQSSLDSADPMSLGRANRSTKIWVRRRWRIHYIVKGINECGSSLALLRGERLVLGFVHIDIVGLRGNEQG